MTKDEIDEMLIKREELENECYALGVKIQKAIAASKNTMNHEEVQELAYDLYWQYNYPAKAIGELLGVSTTQVASTVGQIVTSGRCTDCGEWMDVTYTSRQKYTGNPYETFGVCDGCIAKRKLAEEEKYRIYEEEQRAYREQQAKRQKELATMPYAEYLQTEHWKQTRKAMLKRAGYRCSLCNTKGELHVHHKTYERRGAEWYEDLIVLCHNCHAKFHNKD